MALSWNQPHTYFDQAPCRSVQVNVSHVGSQAIWGDVMAAHVGALVPSTPINKCGESGSTGKQELAIKLSTDLMTQKYDTERCLSNTDTLSSVTAVNSDINVMNLFSIGASKEKEVINEVKPFIHQVRIHGPQGEMARVWAHIDDSTM